MEASCLLLYGFKCYLVLSQLEPDHTKHTSGFSRAEGRSKAAQTVTTFFRASAMIIGESPSPVAGQNQAQSKGSEVKTLHLDTYASVDASRLQQESSSGVISPGACGAFAWCACAAMSRGTCEWYLWCCVL